MAPRSSKSFPSSSLKHSWQKGSSVLKSPLPKYSVLSRRPVFWTCPGGLFGPLILTILGVFMPHLWFGKPSPYHSGYHPVLTHPASVACHESGA